MTAPASASKKPSRFWLFAPFVLAAIGAAAWTGLWFTVKSESLKALDAWVASERAAGREAGYDAATAAGYPLRFELDVSGLRTGDPKTGFSWSAALLTLNLLPYQPNHVIVQSHGPHMLRLDAKSASWTIESKSASASLRWTNNGLARFSLHADGVTWQDPAGRRGEASTLETHVVPHPEKGDQWNVWVSADRGGVPEIPQTLAIFGKSFSDVKATATASKADLLEAGLSPARLAAWSAAGGALTIQEAEGQWGRVKWSGVGELTADASGAPQGRITVTAHNVRDVADIVIEAGWVAGPAAELVRVAAGEAEAKQGGLSTDLVLNRGQLLVFGLPLQGLSAVAAVRPPGAEPRSIGASAGGP